MAGIATGARATKGARSTIGRGLMDLKDLTGLAGRIRCRSAGRPALAAQDRILLDHLEPATHGRPDAAITLGVEEPYQVGSWGSRHESAYCAHERTAN
jgi:hypothetical protein